MDYIKKEKKGTVVASVKSVNVINLIKTWKLFVDNLHLIGNTNVATKHDRKSLVFK